jgi:transposase
MFKSARTSALSPGYWARGCAFFTLPSHEGRDWRIFADFGQHLINLVQPLYAGQPLLNLEDVDNDIFVLDSTSISVSLKLWEWALGKYARGTVKMHTLLDVRSKIPTFVLITGGRYHDTRALDHMGVLPGAIYVMDKAYVDFARLYRIHTGRAFFVTPAKEGLNFNVVTSHPVDKKTGLLCDQRIRLTVWKSRKLYPERIRRIKYNDKEKQNMIILLTNNTRVSAEDITEIYRNRWHIEVFFKLIKQNLEIKTLWGHSENAVNIHIWIAICTYLIIAYIKYQLKSTHSIYEIMQILGTSTFDKSSINTLLTASQINQNVKEQLNLFNII